MVDCTSVRVAVRIRPQITRELLEMCHICTSVTPGEPQVWMGKDKAFTFDQVYDTISNQPEVYESTVQDLIEGCFDGYNATVLAYGQTGSGKTYTMGTGFDLSLDSEERGIIPRAVEHLFKGIAERQRKAHEEGLSPPEFKVNAQFLELYNEEIIDLLVPAKDADEKNRKSNIKIHEDAKGGIYMVGVTTRAVTSIQETMQCLKDGALSRTTASTQMNAQSSRSHAIFTLHIKQQRVVKIENFDGMETDETPADAADGNEFETLTAKFHFVDLAGSERLKRTGATGERAREGISINCGLLALGNVISALGDKTRKVLHVPYRDSKLTRLLQDSLGGNSQTAMIACISPSDRDFMETLNTLKYANRAKNIKNRVVVNQDKSSQTISALRHEVQQLQLELMEYKQGKRIVQEDGTEQVNDMFHENTMLQTENSNLRTRIKALQETVERMTARITELLTEKETQGWIKAGEDGVKSDITELIQGYLKEIEEFRAKLVESEETCAVLRKQVQKGNQRLSLSPSTATVAMSGQYDVSLESEPLSVHELLREAREEVKQLKKKIKKNKVKVVLEESDGEDKDDDTEKEADGGEKEAAENELANEDEEEDESSSESDTEEKENLSEDIAELTREISIKQKLIEQLELSQRRLQNMRHHYEEKLLQLQNKIRETEKERDKMLSTYSSNTGSQSTDKVKRIKDDFEKKIDKLQQELKKMQAAKKEHTKLVRTQMSNEQALQQLKQQVDDMKRTKVRLMNKMKDDAQKHKVAELQKNKEIAQLKKESRLRENKIRTLESEKRMKETVLKRKQEEVTALRKMTKPMSDKVAGRVRQPIQNKFKRPASFSVKAAKQRWQSLENRISKLILNKQSIYIMEKDMDRWLRERERLSKLMEKTIKKRERALIEGKERSVLCDIEDELDSYQANIDYIHQNIADCQSSIMQMEEEKDDMDALDSVNLIGSINAEEGKYILEKMLTMVINQGVQVAEKENSVSDLETRLKHLIESNTMHQQLLQHILYQTHENFNWVFSSEPRPDFIDSAASSRSASPIDSSLVLDHLPPNEQAQNKKQKVRRKTATPEELLYPDGQADMPSSQFFPSLNDVPEVHDANLNKHSANDNLMTTSLFMPNPQFATINAVHRVTSAPDSLNEAKNSPTYNKELRISKKTRPDQSPCLRRRTEGYGCEMSPILKRRNIASPLSRQSSLETSSEVTPPGSPTTARRNRDNVFSRLTSGTVNNNNCKPLRGSISVFTGKSQCSKTSPLVCTHIAEGHTKAVLALTSTDDVLFSGSKDRTVKIWDLHSGQEIQTLAGHPNNVSAVKYSEYTRLAFSASMGHVKIWDVRENPAKCVKTLSSAGLTVPGIVVPETPSRVLQMPSGETQIQDIALNHYGTMLFTAAGNSVRIWDLKMFQSFGRLGGGHQAAVMCLAVDDFGLDSTLVATGSKDHYIKVFEVMEGSGGVYSPKMNLDPPHYDGIQSLALCGDYLFSGSRDMCIKKWDLQNQCLVQSQNQAHKDWVCALDVLPSGNILLSGCRGGFLKLWAVDNCQLLGEIRAHRHPINSISTNSNCIFTASNDGTIGLWRLRSTSDASPESNDVPDDRYPPYVL